MKIKFFKKMWIEMGLKAGWFQDSSLLPAGKVDENGVPFVITAYRPLSYQVCPNCKKEIYEKHAYSDDINSKLMKHRDCGKTFRFEEPTQEEKDFFKKNWGFDL